MTLVLGDEVTWPVTPDWSRPVRETLAWHTSVERSRTAVRQKRQNRLAPRRSFSFQVLAETTERRLIELLCFDAGARVWQLPIWQDAQRLTTGLAAGADEIACTTVGYDFAPGAKALLWRSSTSCEIVAVDAVDGDGLTLALDVVGAWPAGTRLYPLRAARLTVPPSQSFLSGNASDTTVEFQLCEPCDWAATLPATTYRGSPLLDSRPSEPSDPSASWGRQLLRLDMQVGPIEVNDIPQRAFRAQQTFWQVYGRADNSDFRALLYGLAGRFGGDKGGLWLPSWNQDLHLAAAAASGATTISVEWCGYTAYGRQQAGRRDIRIELAGGTAIHRRITGSADAGATETLTLDAALGVAIAPATVRCISFLTFSQLAGDAVELQHVTDADGLTECELNWEMTDEQ